jgi:DNA-binding protein WhiA
MSFALAAKEEIVSREDISQDEKKMFLSGFIKYNGELMFLNQRFGLKLSSISDVIIRKIESFLKEIYKGRIEISVIQSKTLKRNKVYTLFLIDDVRELLSELKVFDWDTSQKVVVLENHVLENHKLLWNYIAGIFVACGSANDPLTSNYHLELQLKDKDSAEYFQKVLNENKFSFKQIVKREKYVCYIKKSNEVSDFLVRIHATNCALKFEVTRTEREMQNQVNRFLNIELHNSQLSIAAAEKQVEMIEYIKSHGMFSELSPKAQILADLRLENPSSSFNELVELMTENGISISKPGVSNLFRNIKKIFESIKGF